MIQQESSECLKQQKKMQWVIVHIFTIWHWAVISPWLPARPKQILATFMRLYKGIQQAQRIKADAAYWKGLNWSAECFLQIKGRVSNHPPYKSPDAVSQ